MAVAVQQSLGQAGLVALHSQHTLQQLVAAAAHLRHQLAFVGVDVDLVLDGVGHLPGHKVVEGAAHMGFERCQIAVKSRALPVAGVQCGQLIEGGGHLVDADVIEGIGKAGAAFAEILQHQQKAVAVVVVNRAKYNRRFHRHFLAQLAVKLYLIGIKGPGQVFQIIGQLDDHPGGQASAGIGPIA